MGNLFGGGHPKPAAPAAPAPAAQTPATPDVPMQNSPIVAQPSQSYVASLASAFGRGATILTSGQGDTSTPTIGKKQLSGTLGG